MDVWRVGAWLQGLLSCFDWFILENVEQSKARWILQGGGKRLTSQLCLMRPCERQ